MHIFCYRKAWVKTAFCYHTMTSFLTSRSKSYEVSAPYFHTLPHPWPENTALRLTVFLHPCLKYILPICWDCYIESIQSIAFMIGRVAVIWGTDSKWFFKIRWVFFSSFKWLEAYAYMQVCNWLYNYISMWWWLEIFKYFYFQGGRFSINLTGWS